MRLLLVEDDVKLSDMLARSLREQGYAVDVSGDGSDAVYQASVNEYDAIILDVSLPKQSGLDVSRALRAKALAMPILMLTARDALSDRVTGLDAGADDYLVKPFELDELNARIRAVLRRHAGRADPLLSAGGVTLDPASRRVARDGVAVPLSAREFAVLEALLAKPGAVLSRAQLEDRLYGWGEEIESNAVSVYVHQLRRKLGADFIRTVRGVGYFVDPAA